MPMRALAASALIALSLAGCGSSGPACADRTTLTGVILDVESRTLTDVRGFTLRSEGEECEILIDPDRRYGFALPHLNEHRISADPVRVQVEVRDDELVAVSIEDAPRS
jgi:hypothetical protein